MKAASEDNQPRGKPDSSAQGCVCFMAAMESSPPAAVPSLSLSLSVYPCRLEPALLLCASHHLLTLIGCDICIWLIVIIIIAIVVVSVQLPLLLLWQREGDEYRAYSFFVEGFIWPRDHKSFSFSVCGLNKHDFIIIIIHIGNQAILIQFWINYKWALETLNHWGGPWGMQQPSVCAVGLLCL